VIGNAGSAKFIAAMLIVLLASATTPAAQKAVPQKYEVSGMLLAADPSRHTITVSCKEIAGYMDAMVMSFPVHDEKFPDGLQPGAAVGFTLIIEKDSSFAQNVHILPFESLELDPTEARRLELVENAGSGKPLDAGVLRVGEAVPDFQFTDQNRQQVSLSQLAGKVVALTFVYTRCPRPDYCVRLSNNFGLLQRRFKTRMGGDLVLLTVVIDPVHDQPEALQNYARTWKADPASWHFLTGSVPETQKLCHRFDMAFYPDEALFVHSFHTAVITRSGRLAANLEGNDFTAQQLGDLVQTVMDRKD
jgi:protein SCO1